MDRTGLQGEAEAVLITVKGRVQGVGFRPFLFRLAGELGIRGTVQNNMDGVRLVAEGSGESLTRLMSAIRKEAPRLSRIDELTVQPIKVRSYSSFKIMESDRHGASSLVIPADSAVCGDCLKEMFDPANPRYRYPFITCTQCGPRYTMIRELPYDRPFTSMDDFPMCEACRREYEDAGNRRHHAEPIACPECGPEVRLYGIGGGLTAARDEAVQACKRLLRQGAIVAVKGLGGFHLACDAADEQAVRRIRQRKNRPGRPLAVMGGSLRECGLAADLSPAEERLLMSPEAPIVIVRKRPGSPLAESIAPGMATIGMMLPYTPLHHLLLEDEELSYLVMTSANPSGQPILYRDDDAFSYLRGIADYILTHNREIVHPLDDSVVQINGGVVDFLRRSRGYVPDPLAASWPVHETVALGGQQKNTFAIGRNEQIFIGPHIGDLNHLEVQRHWSREFGHLAKWMGVAPRLIAVDLHPSYDTRGLADGLGAGIETVCVQHHHAHLVSCAADNGLNGGCYGLVLDGTGFGTDGCLWGFEALYGDANSFRRIGHLRYTPLPGGEAGIRHPWRIAAAMMMALFPEVGEERASRLFPEKKQEIRIIRQMAEKQINSPPAGTCGRLFDAVSAILGVCTESTYDGEAAILLSEQAAFQRPDGVVPYSFEIRKVEGSGKPVLELDMKNALLQIVTERLDGRPVQELAVRFHETVAQAAAGLLIMGHQEAQGIGNLTRRKDVVLSGGCFHNRYLTSRIKELLEKERFSVFTHKRVPCSDGGLALGQLVIAACSRE